MADPAAARLLELAPAAACQQMYPPVSERATSDVETGHGGQMKLEPRTHETSRYKKVDIEQQKSEAERLLQIDLEHKKVDMERQRSQVEGLLALERLHTGGQLSPAEFVHAKGSLLSGLAGEKVKFTGLTQTLGQL